MKRAHEENRQSRERNAVLARAQIRRERHLADVELELPYHPPKCAHEHRHLDEIQRESVRHDVTAL
jgi:hypothetical protein